MALKPCPECNGLISDQAKVCVHCGLPLKTKEGRLTVIYRRPKDPMPNSLALLRTESGSPLIYLFHAPGEVTAPIPIDMNLYLVSNVPTPYTEAIPISAGKHTVLQIESRSACGTQCKTETDRRIPILPQRN